MQVSGSDSVVAEDSSFPGCVRCVAWRTVIDVSKKKIRSFRRLLNIHQSTQSNISKKLKSTLKCKWNEAKLQLRVLKEAGGFLVCYRERKKIYDKLFAAGHPAILCGWKSNINI